MNPDENNENQQPETPNQKRVIQPLNAEEVKAHLAENAVSTPPITTAQTDSGITQPDGKSVYPTPNFASDTPNVAEEEWKPNTPLSSRVPRLKKWGVVYVGAGLLNAMINKNLLTLRDGYKLQPIVFILFVLIVLAIASGLIFIFSKNKLLVQICLNGILLFAVLMALLSLLTISIIGIVISIFFIGSVLSIKREVKAAA